jgi:hypothetical protein
MSHFYTLHFPDEHQAFNAAEALALLDDSSVDLPEMLVIDQFNGRLSGQAQLITDVQAPGTYDPETGEELTPPTPVSGVFVNIVLSRAILHPSLAPYRVPYGSGGVTFAGTEPEPQAWPPAAN